MLGYKNILLLIIASIINISAFANNLGVTSSHFLENSLRISKGENLDLNIDAIEFKTLDAKKEVSIATSSWTQYGRILLKKTNVDNKLINVVFSFMDDGTNKSAQEITLALAIGLSSAVENHKDAVELVPTLFMQAYREHKYEKVVNGIMYSATFSDLTGLIVTLTPVN